MTDDARSGSDGSDNFTETDIETRADQVNQMFAAAALKKYGRVGRDPQRIAAMLFLLKDLWERNPDMRFGQLIGNIYRFENPGTGIEQTGLMNIEDDDFQKRMTAWH